MHDLRWSSLALVDCSVTNCQPSDKDLVLGPQMSRGFGGGITAVTILQDLPCALQNGCRPKHVYLLCMTNGICVRWNLISQYMAGKPSRASFLPWSAVTEGSFYWHLASIIKAAFALDWSGKMQTYQHSHAVAKGRVGFQKLTITELMLRK